LVPVWDDEVDPVVLLTELGLEVTLALGELEMSAAVLGGRNATVAVGEAVADRETVRGDK
jgi:hypothetical protein